MTNPILMLCGDILRRLKLGSSAPLKNQTLYVNPQSITSSIRSDHPAFQAAVLGGPKHELTPERRDRLARKTLRTSRHIVLDSDFDLFTMPLRDIPTYERITSMLAKGQTWEEAGFHQWMMSEIATRGSLDGCRTEEDVRQRYQKLDALMATMKREQTLRSPTGLFGRYGKIDGIIAAIGRDGEVIFCGRGKHRLALAAGLDLPAIPVSICAVHIQALEDGHWAKHLSNSRLILSSLPTPT